MLCRAWQTITLDAITGVEQQSNTYWERIHDHYKDNNKEGLYRSRVSVSHRWQTIQADCQKWAACLAQGTWWSWGFFVQLLGNGGSLIVILGNLLEMLDIYRSFPI